MNIRRTALVLCLGLLPALGLLAREPAVHLHQDESQGMLQIYIDGCEVLAYQYAAWRDLPHFWPMNSPSGKNILVEQTEPYPHHRAFWFADTVRLNGGRRVSTYNALYTGQVIGTKAFGPPFNDHIRHIVFTKTEADGSRAEIEEKLIWEMDGSAPLLDEHRHLVIHALGHGEYLMDIVFRLTASYGDVEFVSDAVHYAWPYLRLHPRFSGENGGIITSDTGAVGQEDTNMKIARWMDYSNILDGVAEGVAVFQWPDGRDHRWLTRTYGTFGPRRTDDRSGKSFTLLKGESISQRAGILVHKGTAQTGRVAERYKGYISGSGKG